MNFLYNTILAYILEISSQNINIRKECKVMEKVISQDEMRKMLHISKRKAKFLLDNGIIPCVNTGKLTRQYRVKLSDVEEFMKQPFEYETGMFSSKTVYKPREGDAVKLDKDIVQNYYRELLSSENDIMTVSEMSEIIGYSPRAIYSWMEKGWIEKRVLLNRMYITKEELIQLLCSKEYLAIVQKSDKHLEQIKEIKGRCSALSA